MPTWSPGGLQLGFLRTTNGRRVLPVYDLTPGLQAILNPPIDLGADAPTPQTRAFQSSWGGLSIAESSALDVPLGKTRTGRNSFRWNGKVDGKRQGRIRGVRRVR